MDIKTENKVISNYHLISLKMFANIYQTATGKEFAALVANDIINFCTFSIESCNGKVVFTAAVDVFNHVLTHKGDIKPLTQALLTFIQKSVKVLPGTTDEEARKAIILAMTRSFYGN
jgi:hypothetical protein